MTARGPFHLFNVYRSPEGEQLNYEVKTVSSESDLRAEILVDLECHRQKPLITKLYDLSLDSLIAFYLRFGKQQVGDWCCVEIIEGGTSCSIRDYSTISDEEIDTDQVVSEIEGRDELDQSELALQQLRLRHHPSGNIIRDIERDIEMMMAALSGDPKFNYWTQRKRVRSGIRSAMKPVRN